MRIKSPFWLMTHVLFASLALLLVTPHAIAQLAPKKAIPAEEWGFIQDEAVEILEVMGFPSHLTPDYGRSEIRAYGYGRLMQIIKKPAAQAHRARTACIRSFSSADDAPS